MTGKCFCCVPLCSNQRNKVKEPISFHRVPTDKDLRSKWIAKIKRDEGTNFKITGGTKVCSKHFTAEDFRPLLHTKKKMLKTNAVPSIFVWNKDLELRKKEIANERLGRIARRDQIKKKNKKILGNV